MIRFDNDPKYYTKRDYYYLIWYLCESLLVLEAASNGDSDVLQDIETLKEEVRRNAEEIGILHDELSSVNDSIAALQNLIADNSVCIEDTKESFPSEGNPSNLYLSRNDNLLYRWDDDSSTYKQINKQLIVVSDLDDLVSLGLSEGIYEVCYRESRTTSELYVLYVSGKSAVKGYTLQSSTKHATWSTMDREWKWEDYNAGEVYNAGESIAINNNTISAVTDEQIKTTVAVGGYEKDVIIEKGTDITEILKTLLEVTVGVKAVNPTLTLSHNDGTPKGLEFEFGTKLKEHTLIVKLNQGYFEPADDRWDGSKQYMNCNLESATISSNIPGSPELKLQEIIDQGDGSPKVEGYRILDDFILTQSRKYTIKTNSVSKNTVNPKNNKNEYTGDSGFAGGKVSTSGSVTFTPYFSAFVGGIDVESIEELTSDNIRAVTSYKLPVDPKSTVLLRGQPTSNDGKKAILIACPIDYTLNSVQSDMGTNITDSFDVIGSVDVKCGEMTVNYTCYLNVVHGECKFQTVGLAKNLIDYGK